MKTPLRDTLLLIGLLVGLTACNYTIDKTGGRGQGNFANADPRELNYDVINQGILLPKCATCHSVGGGNRGGVNLETYENVVAEKSAIVDAVSTGFMPPRSAPALNNDEKTALLAWIQAGAPRN